MKYKFKIINKGEAVEFSEDDLGLITQKVTTYLQKNKIVYGDTSVKDSIIRQSGFVDTVKRKTFQEVVSGAQALIKSTVGISVSLQEMDRRSAICENCPLVSSVSQCATCGTAGKISRFINKMRSSIGLAADVPQNIKLSYCGVCNCSLALMVPTVYSNFNLNADTDNIKRPDSCWLKKGSINFKL